MVWSMIAKVLGMPISWEQMLIRRRVLANHMRVYMLGGSAFGSGTPSLLATSLPNLDQSH